MLKHRVVKVVGISTILGLVLLIAGALYLWNAQYTLMNARRGSSVFNVALYRFRPIAVFEFRSKSVITDRFNRIIFGATTIEKVERVTWLNQNQAVLIDLSSSYDSDPTQHQTHLFFDFKRNCLLTTLEGSTTEAEFAQSIAKVMANDP